MTTNGVYGLSDVKAVYLRSFLVNLVSLLFYTPLENDASDAPLNFEIKGAIEKRKVNTHMQLRMYS